MKPRNTTEHIVFMICTMSVIFISAIYLLQDKALTAIYFLIFAGIIVNTYKEGQE